MPRYLRAEAEELEGALRQRRMEDLDWDLQEKKRCVSRTENARRSCIVNYGSVRLRSPTAGLFGKHREEAGRLNN
jgi:hypothetical protein